jgi:hypothetical protein
LQACENFVARKLVAICCTISTINFSFIKPSSAFKGFPLFYTMPAANVFDATTIVVLNKDNENVPVIPNDEAIPVAAFNP